MARGVLPLALCLFAVGLIGPGPRLPEASASPVMAARLAGRTTVAGQRPGALPVRLTREVTLVTRGEGRDISVNGAGRLVGLVLVKDGRLAFAALQSRSCGTEGCSKGHSHLDVIGPKGWPKTVTLPAGRYDVRLITDGAPVKVLLRLPGLGGEINLAPSGDPRLDLGAPPVYIPAAQSGVAYSSGESFRLDGRSLVIFVTNLDYALVASGETGECFYDGAPPVPDELAYQAACGEMGAEQGGFSMTMIPPGSGSTGSLLMFGSLPAGDYGLGAYGVTGGIQESANALMLRLEY